MQKERRSGVCHHHTGPVLSWAELQLRGCPISTLPISDIRPAESPRSAGESDEHVRLIAESGATLPPIVVHEPTMRVIDGMHRLRAAQLLGADRIEARLFGGDPADAFVIAVQANTTHGLPLPMGDRVHAATRIIGSHPAWSDRAIASAVGLSPKTVAAIRLRAATHAEPPLRIGRDGRIRPVSTAARRQLAGELMTRNPDASLRQIAKAVGLAPSTVMDVRTRLRAGQDLVPDNQNVNTGQEPRSLARRRRAGPAGGGAARALSGADRASAMSILLRDPSLRFSENGRRLLRWLEAQPGALPDWRRIVDSVPEHCVMAVVELARDSVHTWQAVIEQLERRGRTRLRPSGA